MAGAGRAQPVRCGRRRGTRGDNKNNAGFPMSPSPAPDLSLAQRDMLVDGLRHLFGAFEQATLDQLLPALEWVQLHGGDVLFEQGSTDRSLYVLISGRLRAVSVDEEGERKVLGDVARGETVGEMALFTGEPRSATVAAVRDSLLVRFTDAAFRQLLLADPLVALNISKLVVQRFRRAAAPPPANQPVVIALVGITRDVDRQDIAARVHQQLAQHGKTITLARDDVDALLGARGMADARPDDMVRAHQLAGLLERIESEHRHVVLVGDAEPTAWTARCLRHCDQVLMVADADAPDAPHPIEQRCMPAEDGDALQLQRTLVLLHPDDRRMPSGTRRWYAQRRLAGHIHVRRNRTSDWERLGRLVTGNAVGLVLSGGGARGFAHLGVLRALEEAGQTWDLVGGTSIGAVMGAYAAMDLPAAEATRLARDAFRLNPTGDYNLIPLISLIGGKRLRHVIDGAIVRSCGGDIAIEDLWKGYFCVSSNYSTARESVLDRGPLARSVRASVSIPGALPPVVIEGELHIDGGTFNNFPTDVMRSRGAARIIGVNLLRERNLRYELDEMPGTLALLREKLGLSRRRFRLPSLTSVLLNASMMYSYARQRDARLEADLYFSPEVHRHGMLDWAAFDRIVEAGWRHAQDVLQAQAAVRPAAAPAAAPAPLESPAA
jgi:NTE family protein